MTEQGPGKNWLAYIAFSTSLITDLSWVIEIISEDVRAYKVVWPFSFEFARKASEDFHAAGTNGEWFALLAFLLPSLAAFFLRRNTYFCLMVCVISTAALIYVWGDIWGRSRHGFLATLLHLNPIFVVCLYFIYCCALGLVCFWRVLYPER